MTRSLVIVGAAGRMGAELRSATADFSELKISAALVSDNSKLLGTMCSACGIPFSRWSQEALQQADVAIDFSTPATSVATAAACAAKRIPLLIGTTGFTEVEREQIALCATKTPILLAANTSLGVAVLAELACHAQRLLGTDFDVEISEIHHREKKDAPSGTARALADRIAVEGALSTNFSREGKREKGELGISSLRGGGVFGEHTIYFLGNGERIELTHRAENRSIFARGALKLALRLIGKEPRLYLPKDLII